MHFSVNLMVYIDESVDGAAFLDLSEDDVKTMVKPRSHQTGPAPNI